MEHPWIRQLMDHKYVPILQPVVLMMYLFMRTPRWNSFARQTFRSEFHLYFIYFCAVFIAT